jgi:predicted dehydrogenase
MQTEEKIKVGVIGLGNIGKLHANVIQDIPSACLVALSDVNQESLDRAKGKFGVDTYLDYRALIARDDIDVVDICTPSGMHCQMAVEAAQAKKHIVTEKPIEVTLAKADKMIQAAKDNGVKLSVIFQNRYIAGSQSLKKLLAEGRLGTLFLADAYIKWYRPQEYYDSGTKWRGTLALDGGGAIMNQSVHYIDLLQWLAGPVNSIYAHKATVAHKIAGEDIAVAILKYKNGAMGVIEGSTACYPGSEARLELHGTNGSAVLAEGTLQNLQIVGEETPPGDESRGENKAALSGAPHYVQLQRFFQAIREDKDPDVTGEEARKSLEIVIALYRSAETGEVVTLPIRG